MLGSKEIKNIFIHEKSSNMKGKTKMKDWNERLDGKVMKKLLKMFKMLMNNSKDVL
jgi:hypothetical protein